jgi:uncharacterized protein YgbK (DUF1537 family)
MNDTIITRRQLLETLPPPWPVDLSATVRQAVAQSSTRLVILDDDPTGTQTVHGMPVLTTWSVPALATELREDGPGFFILTNSRSLTVADAAALSREIGTNLKQAMADTGVTVEVISRSDSTLRGHFPVEVDGLLAAMDAPERPRILVPCFFEGGRYTAFDIHYVAEGDRLIPAARTPYAGDAAFGYRHSNLREWVVEKTAGAIAADQVTSLSIADIREGGPDQVARCLEALQAGDCCIVNAVDYNDLTVFVAGLMAAELPRGFIFRSAASFVRVRAGIVPNDLLKRTDLATDPSTGSGTGGLFVVGSYVPKTSAQLAALLAGGAVAGIEVKVDDLLDDTRQAAAVAEAVSATNRALEGGRDAVLFTSRNLVTGSDAASSLDIGRRVSDSLIAIVQGIDSQPRYLVAKGGITSSDVATRGLEVRRAMIMGQVLPGVPVWRLGEETRWPGMAYIVFPGNVGDDQALADIRRQLAIS